MPAGPYNHGAYLGNWVALVFYGWETMGLHGSLSLSLSLSPFVCVRARVCVFNNFDPLLCFSMRSFAFEDYEPLAATDNHVKLRLLYLLLVWLVRESV